MSENAKTLAMVELREDQARAAHEIAAILNRLENKYLLDARLDIDRVYMNDGTRAVMVDVALEITTRP